MEEDSLQQTETASQDVPRRSNELPQGPATLPQPAESPEKNAAAVPQSAEDMRQPATEFPQLKRKTDAHSINVRAAVRIFEDAGIPRSPRTIINWCNPNTEGTTKLDCWQDQNDHTYYITQESIEGVIEEEEKRGGFNNMPQPNTKNAAPLPQPAADPKEVAAGVPHPAAEELAQPPQSSNNKDAELRELRRKNVEYEHTILGKDVVIEQLQEAWDKVAERLEKQSEVVGGLRFENQQLKQIEAPRQNGPESADNRQQPIWEMPTDQIGDADEENNP